MSLHQLDENTLLILYGNCILDMENQERIYLFIELQINNQSSSY